MNNYYNNLEYYQSQLDCYSKKEIKEFNNILDRFFKKEEKISNPNKISVNDVVSLREAIAYFYIKCHILEYNLQSNVGNSDNSLVKPK